MTDSNKTTSKKIAIIGAGAAGMMAAATILEESSDQSLEIHLFDKNLKLGVKVAITGGGRCNVTTGINDKQLLLKKYIRGSQFIAPALAAFPPIKVRTWFEQHQLPLKVEEDLRVFPVSDQGEDVVKVFEQIFQDKRIKLHLGETITSVTFDKQNKLFQLQSKLNNYEFQNLIITTGGNAYHHTGSTGDGYAFAKSLGHTITPLGPSLSSFETMNKWCQEISGISLKSAKMIFCLSDQKPQSVSGPMIFTHFGLSGPAIFSLAAEIAFEPITNLKPFEIKLILEPGRSFSDWEDDLLWGFNKYPQKSLNLILTEFFPQRLAERIVKVALASNTLGLTKASEVTKTDRQKISHILAEGLPIKLINRRQGEEFVTAGGVDTTEIESKTMRSKLNPNLYFAGEVLNVDGLTGGFNLQVAWASGRMAGKNIHN